VKNQIAKWQSGQTVDKVQASNEFAWAFSLPAAMDKSLEFQHLRHALWYNICSERRLIWSRKTAAKRTVIRCR